MILVDEHDPSVPYEWRICTTCRGEGRHPNRAIDGNGITSSELRDILDDDPDFYHDYKRGAYDVRCTTCNETGKVRVPVGEE